ncbi:amino acid ABC transporter substrate-binding protein [Aerococcaceae bacterium WGS1372]
MKKIMSKLLLVITAFTLFLTQTSWVKAQEINKEESVIIGFDDTFAPFGFKNEDGEYVGFDIDLAKEILGRLEVEYEFQPIDWSMKETELNTGNIDMIWNGYSVTPEREEIVQFSDPYIKNRQVIIVKVDSEIQSKADFAGKIVATQEQSASLEAIMNDEDFAASIDGGQPITYATFVEVFSDLDNGRADGIVVDELLATYFLEQQENAEDYRILEDNFGEEDYAVGFRKDDIAFVEEFNGVLAEIIEDETFDEIKSQWFTEVEGE